MDLLISIAEIMDCVRRSVAQLEAGERAEGLAQLAKAVESVRAEIAAWEDHSEEAPLPLPELVGELRAVLEDLLAAQTALESSPDQAA